MNRWITGESVVAALALIVSIIALVQGVSQQNTIIELEKQINFDPGQLIIYRPSEYCIRRGLRSFPSDHIILPLNIENTGKGVKTIERLALFFTDPHSGEQHRFILRGLIPSLDTYEVGDSFEITRSITTPERSFQHYNLVFHPDRWWDRTSEDFTYQIRYIDGDTNQFDVSMAYFDPGEETATYWTDDANDSVFFTLTVYETFNNLTLSSQLIDFLRQDPQVGEFQAFLDRQQPGSYITDCFAVKDFPEFPS